MDKPNWEVELPELLAADIRGMSEGDLGQSKGNRTLSWIWKAQGVAAIREDDKAVLSEGKHLRHQLYGIVLTYLAALHIKWCKSRARANHWAEEVELLQEEMRRVASFLSWHAGWWEEQVNRRTVLAAPEQEGIEGYGNTRLLFIELCGTNFRRCGVSCRCFSSPRRLQYPCQCRRGAFVSIAHVDCIW